MGGAISADPLWPRGRQTPPRFAYAPHLHRLGHRYHGEDATPDLIEHEFLKARLAGANPEP